MRTTGLGLMALCAALIGLGGCGSSSSTIGNANSTGQKVPQRDTAPNFQVTVSTDKSQYKVGDPIQITVTVVNTDITTHSLTYPNSSPLVRWGYIIAQNGNIVSYEYWSGHNLFFDTSLTTDTYSPGQSKTFLYSFPFNEVGAVPSATTVLPIGTYQVYARQADLTYDNTTAVRHTTPTPASDPITITVTN